VSEAPPSPEPTAVAPRERVFLNTVSTIAARVASDAFLILAALKQAAYLGEEGWGLYGYLISSMEVFRVLTNFGLDVVALRLMAVRHHTPRAILRHLILLKTLLSIGGAVAVAVLSLFVPRFAEYRGLLLLLAVGLFPVGYLNSVTVRFQAEHRMERLIPVQFASGVLYLGAIYAAIAAGLGVAGFIVIYFGYEVLALALTMVAARLTWRPDGEPPAGGLDRKLLGTIFRQGVPVGLLMLIVVAYSRLGVFLLEHYGHLAAVGHYYIAIKVSEPLLAIAGALSMSAFPVLSRLAEGGKGAELRRRFALYSVRSALLSAAVAVLLTLLGGHLLRLINPEYIAARGALIALSWATAFMFQNQLSTATINSFGKYHYVTGFAAVNLCTYLALALALVPRLGPTGAGLSSLGTEALNTLIQLVAVAVLLRRLRS